MKATVYNKEGKEVDSVSLPKGIFDVKLNSDLLHQVVVSQMANKRQITAHTKDRSEVRGGGKKPWRQKGTGRARHGSIRSPIWRGGGITFGPRKERVFEKDVPKKMRRKALFMVLSEKAKGDLLVVLDKIQADKPKTKEIAKTLNKLPCKENSCLIALPEYDKNLFLSSRNIKKTGIVEARNLNVIDLMAFKYLLMSKDTIKTLEKTFLK
ncbi:MAG: 50S ribosomal protein L4 [Candidatus Staskawiczbacteria bacterium]|nr:50S ribosomal protein L4 [Candidatus Staskawiczbacteria bacterium]MBI3337585.1 50S ribosomal protein L4 [Candidatus Staskawiczbacteria bacterium]